MRLSDYLDVDALMGVVILVCSAAFLGGLAYGIMNRITDKDPTDPPSGRSGLVWYKDHGTGCEYLGKGLTLIPRLGPDGQHMGCDHKKSGASNLTPGKTWQ